MYINLPTRDNRDPSSAPGVYYLPTRENTDPSSAPGVLRDKSNCIIKIGLGGFVTQASGTKLTRTQSFH